jgi:hydrogenase nickel incorporation protein HypA/HybF
MHELGIATSILETVEAQAQRNPGARFVEVGVRIGAVAGVDVDSLTFGWEAIVKDTQWESLTLKVEWVPRINECSDCGKKFEVKDFEIECPKCRSLNTVPISGEELDIAYIEAEEEVTA